MTWPFLAQRTLQRGAFQKVSGSQSCPVCGETEESEAAQTALSTPSYVLDLLLPPLLLAALPSYGLQLGMRLVLPPTIHTVSQLDILATLFRFKEQLLFCVFGKKAFRVSVGGYVVLCVFVFQKKLRSIPAFDFSQFLRYF